MNDIKINVLTGTIDEQLKTALKELNELQAENKLLKEMCEDLAIDLENEIDNRYPADLRKKYPSYKIKYERDMTTINKWKALKETKE